jgi:hypothetical protein
VAVVRAATSVDQDELMSALLAVLRRRAAEAVTWGSQIKRALMASV